MPITSIKMAIVVDPDNAKRYLIRYDNQPFCLVDTEESAIFAIDSIASAEERNFAQKPNVDIFRRNLQNGKEVQILTKTKGLIYDSALTLALTLDFIPVHRMHLESPYAEKIAQYKAEKGKH